jgi:hypothetical protein
VVSARAPLLRLSWRGVLIRVGVDASRGPAQLCGPDSAGAALWMMCTGQAVEGRSCVVWHSEAAMCCSGDAMRVFATVLTARLGWCLRTCCA